jgi:hypothetical protein
VLAVKSCIIELGANRSVSESRERLGRAILLERFVASKYPVLRRQKRVIKNQSH